MSLNCAGCSIPSLARSEWRRPAPWFISILDASMAATGSLVRKADRDQLVRESPLWRVQRPELNRFCHRRNRPFVNAFRGPHSLPLKQPRQVPRSLDYPHDLHFVTRLDEENQVATMPCMTQPFVQLVALLETAGAFAHFDNLRLDLGHEGCCAGVIIERNEVANVDEVCPRGGQNNQLCHDQDLSA